MTCPIGTNEIYQGPKCDNSVTQKETLARGCKYHRFLLEHKIERVTRGLTVSRKFAPWIVSIVGMESQLPADMLPLFANPDKLLQEGEATEYTWADRIRVIPYKVIGQNHQLLTAIKPDILQIQHNEKEYTVTRGLISFTMQQLSADNTYQCIVHPKMLTGVFTQSAS